jgi:hypothetical protein
MTQVLVDAPAVIAAQFIAMTFAFGLAAAIGAHLWYLRWHLRKHATKADDDLLAALTYVFVAGAVLAGWLWFGLLERLTDFVPQVDVFSVSIVYGWLPLAVLVACLGRLYQELAALRRRRNGGSG